VSVVLWYFLIGSLTNIRSGITGTDTQNVMVALADWLQEQFPTNPLFHLESLSSVYGIR
jgi:hypothetical protein